MCVIAFKSYDAMDFFCSCWYKVVLKNSLCMFNLTVSSILLKPFQPYNYIMPNESVCVNI